MQIAIGNSQLVIHGLLEQLSIGRRKPNTKVITTANNNEVLHRYYPMRFQRKYRHNTKLGGKRWCLISFAHCASF